MSENLSKDTVRRVAELARLRLSDEQLEGYRGQLSDVLGHLDKLAELDVDGVEPLAHPLPLTNHLESDHVEPSLPVEQLLHLAPAVEGSFLAVPKVIGESGP